MTAGLERRDFLRLTVKGTTVASAVGVLAPLLATRVASADGPESVQVGEIFQLQAAFHRAKTFQDLNLMMSLWDADGILHVVGDPNSPYAGRDQLHSFWVGSGSFLHHRFSLVPSFKTQIDVHGDTAYLYFECHDVGNFADPAARLIASDTFLAGTVKNVGGSWLFSDMTAGKAAPLSADTYYFAP